MSERLTLWLAALLVAGALCGTSVALAAPKLEVWAIGDGVRIDPETGKAFEDDPKLLPEGLKAGYRRKNAVWDGKVVTLSAARNETVAFQVIIEAPQGARNVALRASDLQAASGGAVIARSSFKLFREWYIRLTPGPRGPRKAVALRAGWYPDPLIPLEAPKHGAPFEIPSKDFKDVAGKHPAQVNQAVWVDLFVPAGARPGRYAGEILIAGSTSAPFRIALPVKLTVWPVTLPAENHTVFDLMCYGKDVVGRPDGVKYYRLVHRHRATISAKGLTPTVVNRGAADAKFDWTSFDRKWSGIFDGSAFTDGPGSGVPVKHTMLRFDHVWPGYAMFLDRDIKNPVGLAAKLKAQANGLTKFLSGRLSPATKKLIAAAKPDPDALRKALAGDLNKVILAGTIYDKKRFEDVLGPKKMFEGIAAADPKGLIAPRNNRIILEKVFPNAIAGRMARNVLGEPAADRLYQRLIKDWEDHFVAKGWTKTKLVVWSDTLDEPKFHKQPGRRAFSQLRDLRRFGKLVHTAGTKNVKYRIDIGGGFARCMYDLDGNGKIEGPKDVVNALKDSIDLWNVHGNCIEAGLLRPLLATGKVEAWFYNGYYPRVGAKYINEEGLGLRTWPWIVWTSQISGCCDWHFLLGANKRAIFLRSNDPGKPGNAQYVYPGEHIGLSDPLPSLRLKVIRRGMQDYEYLWLLGRTRSGKRKADEIALRLVWQTLGRPVGPIVSDDLVEKVNETIRLRRVNWKASWVHDPAKWDAARAALAEAIIRSEK